MMIVDANLLIYAHVSSLSQHAAATTWLNHQFNQSTIVGIPWQSLLSFARIITNPRIFAHPSTIAAAWDQIEDWIACPVVKVPVPGERHREILAILIKESVDRSNLIPDAQLAALAIENGYTLYSTDHDFSRFKGLRWINPLD
jgi:uncharacterized protein